MERKICKSVEGILKETYGDSIIVENKGYYVWVYTRDEYGEDHMFLVAHGYGTEEEPYELILIKANKGITVKKQFLEEDDLLYYLKDTLTKELVLYAI